MKKLLSILFLFALFAGCQEQNIPVEPQESANSMLPLEKVLIPIPVNRNLTVETLYTTSKNIVGSEGGSISLELNYAGGNLGTVSIAANLEFPSGSFEGEKTFSLTFDDQYACLTLLPHTVFELSVLLNMTYQGLDLNTIDVQELEFAFLGEDNSLELIDRDQISSDKNNGKLSMTNARIPHFSRYGFVN